MDKSSKIYVVQQESVHDDGYNVFNNTVLLEEDGFFLTREDAQKLVQKYEDRVTVKYDAYVETLRKEHKSKVNLYDQKVKEKAVLSAAGMRPTESLPQHPGEFKEPSRAAWSNDRKVDSWEIIELSLNSAD